MLPTLPPSLACADVTSKLDEIQCMQCLHMACSSYHCMLQAGSAVSLQRTIFYHMLARWPSLLTQFPLPLRHRHRGSLAPVCLQCSGWQSSCHGGLQFLRQCDPRVVYRECILFTTFPRGRVYAQDEAIPNNNSDKLSACHSQHVGQVNSAKSTALAHVCASSCSACVHACLQFDTAHAT